MRLAVVAASLIVTSPVALAQWYWPPTDASTTIECAPTPVVRVTVAGLWPDSCTPRGTVASVVSPGRIDAVIDHGFPAGVGCLAVITPWSRAFTVEAVPDGEYDVYVALTSDLIPPLAPVRVGSVVVSCGRCPADLDDGTRTGTRDGAVTIDDLVYFLMLLEAGDARGDLDDGTRTGTRDGAVTIDDLIYFLIHLEAGC